MISSFYQRHTTGLCFTIGLASVLIPGILFVTCGDNYVVQPFDQLDSVIERYTLTIRHSSEDVVPEMMGGIPIENLGKGLLIPRVLFAILPTYTAYSLLTCIVAITGYAGMFLLLHEANARATICLVASLMYAYLPFFSAYGLSAMGLAIAAFGFLRVWKNPSLANLGVAFLTSLLFTACSGLVLSGYVVCTGLFAAGLVAFVRGGRLRRVGWCYLMAIPVIIALYIAMNPMMLQSLGSANAIESTRSEMTLSPQPVTIDAIWDFFTTGHYHADANQLYIIAFAFVALVLFAVLLVAQSRRGPLLDEDEWKNCRSIAIAVIALLAIAFLIAAFYVFFHGSLAISIRNTLPGSLRTVQLDRYYWAYPVLWIMIFGLTAELLMRMSRAGKTKSRARQIVSRCVAWVAVFCIAGITFYGSIMGHVVRSEQVENIVARTIDVNYVHPERNTSSVLTWRRYYAYDLMKQIKEDIGEDQGDYRVISVGLHPSVALENGFYTLDGYCAYYPLKFKHSFRKIIAGELELDDNLRKYFDDWGSRCYAFSHELGKRYIIPKTSKKLIKDLNFNLEQLRAMGGKYIISAVEIADSGRYGLRELGRYVTDDSYYCLWAYEVGPGSNR